MSLFARSAVSLWAGLRGADIAHSQLLMPTFEGCKDDAYDNALNI